MRELPSVLTPITYHQIVNDHLLVWEYTDTPITRKAVRLSTAQVAIESGLSSCRTFNISGMKTKPGSTKYNWQFFTTKERFTDAQLERAKKVSPYPHCVEVLGPSGDRTLVKIHPKHPYCCFRAFDNLKEAVLDHLLTLKSTFPKSWVALQTGDPDAYAHALKTEMYYSAKENEYADGLEWRLSQEMKAVNNANIVWGEVL